MAEEPLYGAFGDILTLNDTENTPPADDFTYGVYQIATQKPELEQGQLQKIYGTGSLPIFEWAKTIQTTFTNIRNIEYTFKKISR